jgi:hypothetical protein
MNPLQMLSRALDVLCGEQKPRPPQWQRRYMPAPIPQRSPLSEDSARTEVQRIALSLLDDDCYGFLLLSVRKEEGATRVALDEVLAPEWWPAIRETMLRIVEVDRATS